MTVYKGGINLTAKMNKVTKETDILDAKVALKKNRVKETPKKYENKKKTKNKITKQKNKNLNVKKRSKKSRAQFVVKLFNLLQAAKHPSIISWYKNGFVIWKRKEFAEKLLPTMFNHNKFSFINYI